jgi:hypothetical protein
MFTFSGLVDHIVQLTSRPDRRDLIVTALNSTIRDMHIRPAGAGSPMGSPVKYYENMVEVEFTPVAGVSPVLWPIPKPGIFMALSAMRCSIRQVNFRERSPSSLIPLERDYAAQGIYYKTGAQYAIAGAIPGVPLHIAYFTYLPALAYIAPADRLVQVIDSEYRLVALPDTEPDVPTLTLETNWLLARHWSALLEGTVSRVYRALNDLDRAKIAYSAFSSLQAAIQSTEAHE